MNSWQQAAAQLQGLLALRDGVEKLARAHEKKADELRANGQWSQLEVQERYARRLRNLLPKETPQ